MYAPKRIRAATDSNRKWLKPGCVGFLHTCSSIAASIFSAMVATGAICTANTRSHARQVQQHVSAKLWLCRSLGTFMMHVHSSMWFSDDDKGSPYTLQG